MQRQLNAYCFRLAERNSAARFLKSRNLQMLQAVEGTKDPHCLHHV